jgi:hypothetical protein
MKKLCRRLDLRLYQAVGMLELLWHTTAKQAPQGDIGKLSDEDIALALDYAGDESALIEALIVTGWLDRHEEHRLLVHDWHEHADDATRLKLKRWSQQTGETKNFLTRTSVDVATEARNVATKSDMSRDTSTEAENVATSTAQSSIGDARREHVATNPPNVATPSRQNTDLKDVHARARGQSQSQSPAPPEPYRNAAQKRGRDVSRDDNLPPEALAHGVMLELGISGTMLLRNLTDVVNAEMTRGSPSAQIRDALINAWRFYERNAAKMKWPVPPDKFFGNGNWRNMATLPWKEGMEPKPRKQAASMRTIDEQLTQQR